ncbi:hypothetical protein IEQ34_001996 [Dendrobium chrysotoxum]|uniref:Uncharacterized protein n=1 Tax=Dendrobium chrysotoxum TaxID=161865 RepID=A0AAV7H4Q6_DENCH|nr:hypothetical protein IEQ34_001996 [Dendrobium chrysotoxum]
MRTDANQDPPHHAMYCVLGDVAVSNWCPDTLGIRTYDDDTNWWSIKYSQMDSLPSHNELLDAHGSSFYHIEESNLEDCTPSIVQNGAGKSSIKLRPRNKKLKTNVENLACTDQIAKKFFPEMDDDYGGDNYIDDDLPKQKKRKLPRKSSSRSKHSEVPRSTANDTPKKRLRHGRSHCKSARRQGMTVTFEAKPNLTIYEILWFAGFTGIGRRRLRKGESYLMSERAAVVASDKKMLQEGNVVEGPKPSSDEAERGERMENK